MACAAQIFPASCPRVRWIFTAEPRGAIGDRSGRFVCGFIDEYQTAVEEFLAYGSVLLRLAFETRGNASLTLGPL